MERYRNSKLPAAERASDLLSRMTAEEKLAQMTLIGANEISMMCEKLDRGEELALFGTFVNEGYDPKAFNKIQRYFAEHTRLGIPILLASENTHGVCHPETAIFPTAGCLAATFQPELAFRMAETSGKEAYALGIRQVYAPNVDIPWDPRWGRMEENYGEDPFLSGTMAAAYVRGIQGQGVAATVKHYLGYGVPEGGLNLAPQHLGVRELKNGFLYPFRACIDAGVMSLMPSYGEIDGIPVHVSEYWMKTVLRKELGFGGVVVSDYGALGMVGSFHRISESAEEIGKTALRCGIDVEAAFPYAYGEAFQKAVFDGSVSMKQIDECVLRILTMKFALGLFENPYANENAAELLNSREAQDLAFEIAQKGIVMLNNDGVLPLKGNFKIAAIGPNADFNELGDYIYYDSAACTASSVATLKEALCKRFGRENVSYQKGCSTLCAEKNGIERALEVAKNSDVIVLALGSNSRNMGGGEQRRGESYGYEVTSGEGFDMPYVELPPCQIELTKALASLNKPVVALIYGGRAHAVTEILPYISAMFCVFGPGEKGSEAIVSLLAGDAAPSGKLPFSMPRSTGHIPCFYNHKNSARGFYQQPGSPEKSGRDYVTDSPSALFPFGYGLSYVKFCYSALDAKRENGEIVIRVRVRNTGNMYAEETVLAFSSCCFRDVTPEVKKLCAFCRVGLHAGEEKEVVLPVDVQTFSYYSEDLTMKRERGKHIFSVGDLQVEMEI